MGIGAFTNGHVTFAILAMAMMLMFYFAYQDHKSLVSGNHVDQKSVIVSIGVLGTFIGIATGLWEFDTEHIDTSVPVLLEGLKLAFMTSIAGMSISIALSWVQKSKITGGNDELSVLSEIKGLLKDVQHLEPLLREIKGMRLEARDEQKMTRTHLDAGFMRLSEDAGKAQDRLDKIATVESINDFRNDVHEEQVRSRTFLEEQFKATNESLKETIDVLSKGATEEIIKALEQVISDFNSNLTEQFGDNFKQLNQAVLSLVQWQENYKSIIEKDTKMLNEIRESMARSDEMLKSIADRNEEVKTVYERLRSIIEAYDKELSVINDQMQRYSELGKQAAAAFEKLGEGFERVQNGMSAQSESLSNLTKEIERKLPEALGELESTLVGLTRQFGDDYKSFLDSYLRLVRNQ